MSAHGSWKDELSTFEKYAKGWLAALFGLSPAAAVGVLALFGVHIPAGVVASLLGLLGPLLGVAGVVVGPENKTALDTSYAAILTSTDSTPYPGPATAVAESQPPTTVETPPTP